MSQQSITAAEISRHLICHLRASGSAIVLPNIFIGCSSWESDVVRVTKSGCWSEYEIKVSVSDYKADFQKRRGRIIKHQAYSSRDQITGRRYWATRTFPKPKQFYFVFPESLIDHAHVPPHCGIIEMTPYAHGIRADVTRRAPVLKNHTKLSYDDMYSLALKASYRVRTSTP